MSSAPPSLTSPLLERQAGVRHAFFTRQGGVSTGVYASLNVGVGSRDDPEAVLENRARAAAALGAPADHLLTCYQIHSAIAVTADGVWAQRPEADAVASGTPGLVLGALSADCAPVLLADPQARVIGAAHAGWKGALGGVIQAAVDSMTALGAEPGRIVAAVGPCIAPGSYEVGLEFLQTFLGAAPGSERFFSPGAAEGKRQFELPGFVLDRLAAAGVGQAEWIGQ
ncbi:MAG TPA: polyphenol oxidase family protein, partial [Caulobacteraceae bacterium]